MGRLLDREPLGREVVEAIRTGEVSTLRRLLAENPALARVRIVSDGDDAQRSLLHVATDWPGHFPNVAETIHVLVAAGAEVDAAFVGPHEEVPLHWAASTDDVANISADAVADTVANFSAFAIADVVANASAVAVANTPANAVAVAVANTSADRTNASTNATDELQRRRL